MDKKELNDFISEYGMELLRFCKIITNNEYEAEELYQETMLRVVEHYKKVKQSDNVKGWVISTALNLHKNMKRKFAWRKRIAKQESYEQNIENGLSLNIRKESEGLSDSPENKVIKNEMIQAIRDYVKELPEKYKMPIYLYYTADMKIKEIAQLYDLSENTVKSRLRKAKQIIKEKVEKEWI